MLETLRPLAVFARTVETGSFRAAAAALRLSPSVVSHHISQLEKRLGVALLYRNTRRLALTPDGKLLLQSARSMLAAAEAGLDAFSNQVQQSVGELRLTVPAALAASDLTDDLAGFALVHPNIRLSLNFTDSQRDLVTGQFDLGIRMGRHADSTLKTKRLDSVRHIVVATPSYLKSLSRPSHPKHLEGCTWLDIAAVQPSITFRHKKTGKRFQLDYDRRLTIDDANAMYRMAKTGLGLVPVPEFLARNDLATGIVKQVLPDWELDMLGIHAIWHANSPREGLTMRLVDYLSEKSRSRR